MRKLKIVMISAVLLVDACCESITRGMLPDGPWVPRGGKSYCNYSVNFIARSMGCNDFVGKLANEIAEFLSGPQTLWEEVDGAEAQKEANLGRLTVAAWYNPHGSGHVAVVRLGVAEMSKKWGKLAPKIVNIGKTNFINKGANWGFGEEPKYYIWLG